MEKLGTLKMKELQKQEAVKRLGMLNLMPQVTEDFEKGVLNCSETIGILYWLTDDIKSYITEWEKETGNIAYHLIKNNMEFGLCYSILYVSQHQDEWEMDINDLNAGYPLVYVYNETCPECSEYGSIGVQSCNGGLRRTA